MKEFFVEKTPTFDVKATLDCGQIFRYDFDGTKWSVCAGNHHIDLTETDGGYLCLADDENFFRRFLDFDTNYDIIQEKVQDKGLVSSAIEFGRGIRILHQDVTEMLFSFIVSQNNFIPRIKAIIGRICDALGEDMGGYKAFPSVEKLANQNEDFYAKLGAGYRAEYLDLTAKRIVDEGLPDFEHMDTPTARKVLLGFKGVGRKVADCVLLFGLHRMDVFPVDTWILKVFENEYPKVSAEKLAPILVQKYGEYAGYVQQWLFYFKRSSKNG